MHNTHLNFTLGNRHLCLKLSHDSIKRNIVNGHYINCFIVNIWCNFSEPEISGLWFIVTVFGAHDPHLYYETPTLWHVIFHKILFIYSGAHQAT